MERIEYRNVVDKSQFASRGEWDQEPDKIQWQDDETSLPCLIVRGAVGALCGYVGVSEDHPLYGKSYDDVNLDAHGGLTFANPCSPDAPENRGICHKSDGADHIWWFGFDCCHLGDFIPSYDKTYRLNAPSICGVNSYKNIAYVEAECRKLAKQLKGME